MNKRWLAASCALLLILLPLRVQAGSATVEDEGENRYKAVRLPPEVYHNASADLSDLRLFDQTGDTVPYFIRSGGTSSQIQTNEISLSLADRFEKDGVSYFDFAAKKLDPLTDLQATSILFECSFEPFAKEVSLLGSHDGLQWQPVCNGTLYRVDGQEQLELYFDAFQKFTHYRLSFSDPLGQILFEGAMLRNTVQSSQFLPLSEELSPAFSVAQEGKETKITLSGLRHLKLSSLTLETDSMFRRPVSVSGQKKLLYQLSFSDVSYRDTTLELDCLPLAEDTLTVTIYNGDDKPLAIQNVTVTYDADELIFAGTKGPYRLTFGEPLESPQYDIASYREQVLAEPIDQLRLGALELSGDSPTNTDAELDWQLIFNIVIIGIAVLLGVIILLRIQKSDSGNDA